MVRLTAPLLGARIIFGVTVLAAAWFGQSWYTAAQTTTPAVSQLRDEVLQTAEQAVINVSSLNYQHVASGIRLWEQSSTGSFLAGIKAGRKQLERTVATAKTVTTARVLDGALTSLRPATGVATFIVAEQTTVTKGSGSPNVTQYRLLGQLTLTKAGWKLSKLTVVPTGTASS
jgi:Mce-associated membrane protein